MKKLLAAMALLGAPFAGHAQPVAGLYVAGGAGANLMPFEGFKGSAHEDAVTLPAPFQNIVTRPTNVTFSAKNHFDAGAAAVISAGYGLGNGFRFEIEGDYRYNPTPGSTNREQKFGGMANALFDLDVGSPYVFPYFGAGAGYMRIDNLQGAPSLGAFAYQGIAGAATPVPWVTGLSLTLEYRFMGLAGEKFTSASPATAFSGARTATYKYDNDLNNTLLVGLRYAFGAAAPVPPPAPAAEAPAPAPARTYLVFFDWDRADLTDRARQIITEAAAASTRVQTTRIEVQGNADRSGSPEYNQALSLRRAQTVAAELVRHGVPQSAIAIEAFGDTRPLVPTAAGVREPQNRRVAIILK